MSSVFAIGRVGVLLLCGASALYGQAPDDRLNQIMQAKLQAEQKADEASATPAEKASAAAWELTFAETAVERGADAGLWSSALDEFELGLGRFEALEATLAGSAEEEQKLSSDPLAALQVDAMRARQAAIAARIEIAREAERGRLNRLREIAAAYRKALDHAVGSDVYDRIGDYERLRESTVESLNAVAEIYGVARSGQDPHLFVDEPAANPDTDFDAVKSSPEPLAVDVIAQLKALHSLAAYRLATRGSEVDAVALAAAKNWSEAALAGTGAVAQGLPAGHDAENVLALYVASLVDETTGVQIVSAAPESAEVHASASDSFARAKQGYDSVLARIGKLTEIDASGSASEPLATLASDVRERRSRLEESSPYLVRANAATVSGQPEEALRILREGANVHRDARLWTSLLDSARRSDLPSVELLALADRATSEGLLGQGSDSQVCLAQAEIAAAWNEISRLGLSGMEPSSRESLRQRLLKRRSALGSAISSENSATTKAHLQAASSLATVYASMLDPDADQVEADLREALEMASESVPALDAALGAAPEPGAAIESREALIAARLALGHIAFRLLPDYRQDASLAFASAFDEMGKLPYGRTASAALGSPMFDALARRSEMAGYEAADREREARRLVERFLEGVYALQFGDPGEAADRMQSALATQTSVSEQGSDTGFVDAAEEFRQADGFDSEISLRESVHSFTALAEVRAGRPEAALRSALLAVDAATDVSAVQDPAIDAAVSKIRSPLVGFALASALEASALALDLDDRSKQESLIGHAKRALERASQSMESSRVRSRYPQLESQLVQIRRRLESDSTFVENASENFRNGDWAETSRIAGEGLRRHPASIALRQLLLDAEIEQLTSTDAKDAGFQTTLERIADARRDGLLTDHQERFATGRLYESWGQYGASLDAYESALVAATEPDDRIRTRSRLSELRLRSAVVQ